MVSGRSPSPTGKNKVALTVDDVSLVALDDLSRGLSLSQAEVGRRLIRDFSSPAGRSRLEQFYRDQWKQIVFHGPGKVSTYIWEEEIIQSWKEVSKLLGVSRSEAFRMMVILRALEHAFVRLRPVERYEIQRVIVATPTAGSRMEEAARITK